MVHNIAVSVAIITIMIYSYTSLFQFSPVVEPIVHPGHSEKVACLLLGSS